MKSNKIGSPDSRTTSLKLEKGRLPTNGKGVRLLAIGASAGGLEALELFFKTLQPDLNIPVVVIQHLSTDYKSMMDALLSKHTAMPVTVAEQDTRLQNNHVYLIPSGKILTINHDGAFDLRSKPPATLSLPVDLFFNSMAAELGKDAIAVVLSGTGSDGAKGLATVKQYHGKVFVQSPASAKFDGMPLSAIASVTPDLVETPERLAWTINQYVTQPQFEIVAPMAEHPNESKDDVTNSPLSEILARLHEVYGIDFSEYKLTTVERRIQRRVQVNRLRGLQDYQEYLAAHSEELDCLKQEILITVSSFFRDQKVFAFLKEHVIADIIKQAAGQPIRVWVAGCATGEEAYSYAMLFIEAFEALQQWPQFKIFATDVEQANITFASAGAYPLSIENELGLSRAERFFIKKDKNYVVQNVLRQHIVFAKHNVLQDPPFTNTHLVSCRNTLIYFQHSAQQRAFQRFHYSLLRGGYLVLGSSESISAFQNDFIKINAKLKIFQQNKSADFAPKYNLTPAAFKGYDRRRPSVANVATDFGLTHTRVSPSFNLILAAQNLLLTQYVPSSFLIDSQKRLVHVYGNAHPFLKVGEGAATLEISKMLIARLAPTGVALLHTVMTEKVASSAVVELPVGELPIAAVRVVVQPLHFEANSYCLMTIEPVSASESPPLSLPTLNFEQVAHDRILSLEAELAASNDSLQATIEELETSNEELQSTNEELMSSNEELQSTNEELQSVNEELYTVNSENQEQIETLNRLNNDLENITRASLIPTLFLDRQLNIIRFTNEIGLLFRLRAVDVGRSIKDFSHELDYPEFIRDINQVIAKGLSREREVRTWNQKWYLVRILPFKEQKASQASGVVITLVEITSLKDSQRLQAIIDSLPEHIAVLDNRGVIAAVNQSWRSFAQANGDHGLNATGPGVNYLESCEKQLLELDSAAISDTVNGIRDVLSGRKQEYSTTYPCHSPTEQRWFVMYCKPVEHINGGVVISHVNITEWMQGRVEV